MLDSKRTVPCSNWTRLRLIRINNVRQNLPYLLYYIKYTYKMRLLVLILNYFQKRRPILSSICIYSMKTTNLLSTGQRVVWELTGNKTFSTPSKLNVNEWFMILIGLKHQLTLWLYINNHSSNSFACMRLRVVWTLCYCL